MKEKFLVSICSLLFCTLAFSQDRGPSDNKVNFSLGAGYLSQSVFRGAQVWPVPVLMPILGLNFYNRVIVTGPGLGFPLKNGRWTFTPGFQFFDDNGSKMFSLRRHDRDYRNKRASSFDLYAKFSYKSEKGALAELSFSEDLKSHDGFFSTFKAQIPVIPLTSLGYLVGYGDGRACRYSYGPEALSGFAYHSLYLNLMLPFLPRGGVIMVNGNVSSIIQKQNRNADYVRGHGKQETFSLMMSWNL